MNFVQFSVAFHWCFCMLSFSWIELLDEMKFFWSIFQIHIWNSFLTVCSLNIRLKRYLSVQQHTTYLILDHDDDDDIVFYFEFCSSRNLCYIQFIEMILQFFFKHIVLYFLYSFHHFHCNSISFIVNINLIYSFWNPWGFCSKLSLTFQSFYFEYIHSSSFFIQLLLILDEFNIIFFFLKNLII